MVKNDRENSNNNLDQGPAINLVMAPPWGVEMPPLALALLAGQLKAHNIPAKIYDLNIEAWNLLKGSGNIQAWNMENQNQSTPLECLQSLSKGIKDFPHRWGEEIIRNKPLIVGFSVNSRNALISIEIAKSIKNMAPEIFTVFGGPEALSLRNYQGKDGCISAWVLGEGEGPLIKLYDRLSWGDGHKLPNLMDIEGIVHKRRHSFMPWELLSRRVLNHDLDALGDSDFSQFDLKKYEKPYIPALMSRGCVGRCHYCIDRIISGQLRLRSPLKVADECQKLKREYGISHIEFNDLLCNGDKDHLESVCLALIEKGSPVSWSSYAMIRPFMDKQLLALMKKAGCSHLSFGLESGSSRVLKEMGKYYDAIIAGRVLKDTHLAGISASVNLIVGYPGEGADGLEETIAFIRENARYIHQVTNLGTCFICPGSDLEIRPQDFNIVLPVNDYLANWIDKDQSRLKERRQKLERIKELLKELNLAPKVTNMPDFASGQVGKT